MVIRNITVIHNVNSAAGRAAFMRGPQPNAVERYTHTTIRPVTIHEASRPGRGQVQNGLINIYRPAVNRVPAARPRPATNSPAGPAAGKAGLASKQAC